MLTTHAPPNACNMTSLASTTAATEAAAGSDKRTDLIEDAQNVFARYGGELDQVSEQAAGHRLERHTLSFICELRKA